VYYPIQQFSRIKKPKLRGKLELAFLFRFFLLKNFVKKYISDKKILIGNLNI